MRSPDRGASGFSYRKYYGDLARDYDALRIDRETEIALACDVLDGYVAERASVLDVGCGTGRYGAVLAGRGHVVTGLDISADQLDHAHGLDSKVCASSTAMPFSDRSFDACMAIMFLQQLDGDERRRTFAECHRVLRSDGWLLVKTASHDDLRRRPFGDLFPSMLDLNLRRYPDTSSLTAEMLDAGFEIKGVQSTHTTDVFAADEFIAAARGRHNTTLAMLPATELDAGCQALERALASEATVTVDHWHTLLVARRAGDGT